MNPHSFFLQLIQKDFSEFQEFLRRSTDEEVRQLLTELHPADIADIVENLGGEEKGRIMALLPTGRAASVLSLVDEYHQPEVVEAIHEEALPKILDAMSSDDATDILEELPPEEAEEILEAMPREEAAPVRQLLGYPPDTAGGLMQTELVSVPPEITMGEAILRVREKFTKLGDIINCYVVDPEGRLIGLIPLRSLIIEGPDKTVAEVMEKNVISVPVDMDQENVAALFKKYDYISMPVVDRQGKLLGRILVDDIVDVIEQEASEDLYQIAGVAKEEHVQDPPLRTVRLRLPWLAFNLLTAILAASVVGFFQGTIQKLVVLAVFMPIVAGMGGNAGTQSLTVVTRAIALGEVALGNAKYILLKQILAGLINGILLGLLMAVLAYFYEGSVVFGLVLGLAMVCNMFVAALAGTAIPLVLRWAKVDPALASGVIVTTFTDITGFFSFLGLATLFLHYLT